MTADRPGKRKSHPTSKARNRRQKAKKKAARDRESASGSGVAAITPRGQAVRDEYLKATTYPFTGRGCQRDRAGPGGECASHLLRSM